MLTDADVRRIWKDAKLIIGRRADLCYHVFEIQLGKLLGFLAVIAVGRGKRSKLEPSIYPGIHHNKPTAQYLLWGPNSAIFKRKVQATCYNDGYDNQAADLTSRTPVETRGYILAVRTHILCRRRWRS